MSNLKEVSDLEAHTGKVKNILVTKYESTLYSLGENGQVFKWGIQLQHPRPIELYHQEGQSCGMDLSSDNKFLSTAEQTKQPSSSTSIQEKLRIKPPKLSNSTVRWGKITELNRFLAFGDNKCLVHFLNSGLGNFCLLFEDTMIRLKLLKRLLMRSLSLVEELNKRLCF